LAHNPTVETVLARELAGFPKGAALHERELQKQLPFPYEVSVLWLVTSQLLEDFRGAFSLQQIVSVLPHLDDEVLTGFTTILIPSEVSRMAFHARRDHRSAVERLYDLHLPADRLLKDLS
jgi:hypothetical protein